MYMYFKQLFAPLVGRNPAGVWSAAKLQSLLLTLTLMVAAFGVFPTMVVAQKMVKDPSTGKMVSAPKYGGTIRLLTHLRAGGHRSLLRLQRGGLDRAGQREAGCWRLGIRPEFVRLQHAIPARRGRQGTAG